MSPNYAKIMYIKILLICVQSSRSSKETAPWDSSRIEDMPYVVILKHLRRTFCSGAIISNIWVLTSGECLRKKTIEGVQVYAGIDLEFDPIGLGRIYPGGEIRDAEKFVIHPEYHKNVTNGKDIGLLKVKEEFNITKKVGILSLSGDDWPLIDSRKCMVAGWKVNDLKKIEVQARNVNYDCDCPWFMKLEFVCTHKKQIICPYFAGSVLNCDGKGVGVASFLYGKENCEHKFFQDNLVTDCEQKQVAYTYVCPHLDWIKSYVPEVPKSPLSCPNRATATRLPNHILIEILMLLIKLYTL